MDWSLVLASQSIETVIEHQPEAGWALVVAAADHERALDAIRRFRIENLRWPWRRPVIRSGLVFDWAGTGWVLLTLAFYWRSSHAPMLRDRGMMDGAKVAAGESWRLLTACFLHADLPHLATNAGIGLILLGLAMGRFGTGVGLFAALVAGVCGNVAAWIVNGGDHHSLGASGVVMGALGLLAAPSVEFLRRSPHALRHAVCGIAGGVMLFVLMGLNPGTDVTAHLGGFVTGAALGGALAWVPRLPQRGWLNLLAAIIFASLVIGAWWRALSPMLK